MISVSQLTVSCLGLVVCTLSVKDLAWIEFLTRLRATGMPIRHMQEFAALRRQGNTTIAKRRALLEAHQQMVQTHIEELQQNLEAISQKREKYHQGEEN
jgi:DNA-binding transcriptional MerR regulator